jgi:hypothetical protein
MIGTAATSIGSNYSNHSNDCVEAKCWVGASTGPWSSAELLGYISAVAGVLAAPVTLTRSHRPGRAESSVCDLTATWSGKPTILLKNLKELLTGTLDYDASVHGRKKGNMPPLEVEIQALVDWIEWQKKRNCAHKDEMLLLYLPWRNTSVRYPLYIQYIELDRWVILYHNALMG